MIGKRKNGPSQRNCCLQYTFEILTKATLGFLDEYKQSFIPLSEYKVENLGFRILNALHW
jgi:hypothetical protein